MGRELPVEQCKSDLELHGLTQCAHCGDLLHQTEAVIKQYYQGRMTLIEHFCSDSCHHQWYINRLRSFGL